jgi:segregation and condensation protein A
MVVCVGTTVTTAAFEGPIDLLLHLVNTHQVDLYDIPLASVVDAFVAEVAGWDTVDLQALSEFLMIAAVLVELKSRRLLPGPDDVDPDEELVGWEERDLLLARLLECRAYASAADAFAALSERAARSVPRIAGLDPEFVVHAPDLLEDVTPDQVAAAFHRATAERPVPTVDLYHVTVDTVTVADAVSVIGQRLEAMGRTTFRTLTRHLTARIEIIVSFLALLELFKQGRVSLDQGHTFGDLDVAWVEGASVPVAVGAGGGVDEYEG